jgi:hypothetical protein
VLNHTNPQSDTLLWSEDGRFTLFRGLSPDEQRVSAAQQWRFVLAVVTSRPVEVMAEVASNTVEQLLNLDLGTFNYSEGNRERYERTIPPSLLQQMKTTRAYAGSMPVDIIETTTALLSIVSLLLLVVILLRTGSVPQQLRDYSLCIVLALLLNAGICGALSGPKGRYQLRLIWVLPVVASSIASAYRRCTPSDPEIAPSLEFSSDDGSGLRKGFLQERGG